MNLIGSIIFGLVLLAVGIPLLRVADRECSSEGFLMAGAICFTGAMFALVPIASMAGAS